ncbi:MAG: MlaD family protein [Candidatus Ancaeobacter aquaticus]|nr:MlaD family protein [Candidatus Ancaeobacter aquaticus]
MSFRTKYVERVAGMFVIGVICSGLVLLLIVSRQQDWFAKTYILKGQFNHGTDIHLDTVVSMEGIAIGKVKDVNFNEQNKIEVLLCIKEKYQKQIRSNSFVSIVTPNILRSSELQITLGSVEKPILKNGAFINVRTVKEVTMQDLMFVTSSMVQLLKDVLDPDGPYKSLFVKLDTIAKKIAENDSSVFSLLCDDGKLFRDTRDLVEFLNNYQKENNSLPIHITDKSELFIKLNTKLDSHSNVLAELMENMNVISKRVVDNQGMAGEIVSNKQLYNETLKFMRESKTLIDNLNLLSNELKLVLPKLPELIDSANKGMSEMQEVMGAVKRLPFIRTGIREEQTYKPIEFEGRIERKE